MNTAPTIRDKQARPLTKFLWNRIREFITPDKSRGKDASFIIVFGYAALALSDDKETQKAYNDDDSFFDLIAKVGINLSEAEEEEITYAIALVTLCGSLASVLLPLLRNVLSLSDPQLFGSWVGASVHDVAQVIATSSTGGDSAVQSATVVKLSRVVLLAPLVAIVSIWVRRFSSGLVAKADKKHVSIVPLFVIGFLVMIAVRTTGVIPDNWLATFKTIEQVCLASALVGLGSDVRIARLIKVGGRPLLLALISWFGIAVVSLIGVRLIT